MLSSMLLGRRPAQPRCALVAKDEWVLGLNKYSHDATACLLSTDGKRSVVVPKERLTRELAAVEKIAHENAEEKLNRFLAA